MVWSIYTRYFIFLPVSTISASIIGISNIVRLLFWVGRLRIFVLIFASTKSWPRRSGIFVASNASKSTWSTTSSTTTGFDIGQSNKKNGGKEYEFEVHVFLSNQSHNFFLSGFAPDLSNLLESTQKLCWLVDDNYFLVLSYVVLPS